jgi:hypothetical protein
MNKQRIHIFPFAMMRCDYMDFQSWIISFLWDVILKGSGRMSNITNHLGISTIKWIWFLLKTNLQTKFLILAPYIRSHNKYFEWFYFINLNNICVGQLFNYIWNIDLLSLVRKYRRAMLQYISKYVIYLL